MNRPRAFGAKAASRPRVAGKQRLANLRAHFKVLGSDGGTQPCQQPPRRAPRRCSAATVASMTPAANPRQPACAAATRSPESAASNTGRQSAVRMAHTRPRRRVNAASAASLHRRGGPGSIEVGDADPMHLREPRRLGRQSGRCGQAPAILGHGRGCIAHMIAQVERGIGGAAARRRSRKVESARTPRGAGQSAASSRRSSCARRYRLAACILAQGARATARNPAAPGCARSAVLPVRGCSNPSVAACRAWRLNARKVSMRPGSRRAADRSDRRRPDRRRWGT